jgi:hypothetical protein
MPLQNFHGGTHVAIRYRSHIFACQGIADNWDGKSHQEELRYIEDTMNELGKDNWKLVAQTHITYIGRQIDYSSTSGMSLSSSSRLLCTFSREVTADELIREQKEQEERAKLGPTSKTELVSSPGVSTKFWKIGE